MALWLGFWAFPAKVQVQPLVGELIPHKLHGMAKKPKPRNICFYGLKSLKYLEAYQHLGIAPVLRLNVLKTEPEFGQIVIPLQDCVSLKG